SLREYEERNRSRHAVGAVEGRRVIVSRRGPRPTSSLPHMTLPDPIDAFREAERIYGRAPAPLAAAVPPPISASDWMIVRALSKEGLSVTEITSKTGLQAAEVERIVASFKDTREAARQLLEASAHVLAERVVQQADVEQALEVLDRLDVAPRRDRSGD